MKSVTTAIAAALLLAGAGTAAAQQVDERCEEAARQAGLSQTHRVVFREEDNSCVATPLFGGGSGGGAGGSGATGALGTSGGVLAGVAATVVIAVAVTGGT